MKAMSRDHIITMLLATALSSQLACGALSSPGVLTDPNEEEEDLGGEDLSTMTGEDMDMSPGAGEDMPVDLGEVDEDMPLDMCTPSPREEVCAVGVCGEQSDGCGGTIDCGGPLSMEEACQGTCGAQPDGCGGTIECEPCACEGGVPAMERCGACNLGVASCEGDIFSCDEPAALADLLTDCARIVYVDANFMGIQDGSREKPYNSLENAMLDAASRGAAAVFIAGDDTFERDTMELVDGLSVVGGFTRDWAYDSSLRPLLSVRQAEDAHTVGIAAVDITSPTRLMNLRVSTADAAPTYNNYGIRAVNAGGLTLGNVLIEAGSGGKGQDGTPGTNGDDGGDGGDGTPGKSSPTQTLGVSESFFTPLGGQAGINPSCLEANGGAGGPGGYHTGGSFLEPPSGAEMPVDGGDSLVALGGPAGTSNNPDGTPGIKPPVFVIGQPHNIQHGEAGSGGKATSSIGNDWLKPDGTGEPGTDGKASSGGSGGGGGYHSSGSPYLGGGSGGGGGAGGCGGKAGQPGHPGGTSIAALFIDSNIIRVNSSTFTANIGGHGGVGGDGGAGGQPGKGGAGTDTSCEAEMTLMGSTNYQRCSPTSKGGDGGDGLHGGMGGPGGGGAGGDSVGAACKNTQIITDGNVTFAASEGGEGGAGGTFANGAPGNAGEKGRSIEQFDCLP